MGLGDALPELKMGNHFEWVFFKEENDFSEDEDQTLEVVPVEERHSFELVFSVLKTFSREDAPNLEAFVAVVDCGTSKRGLDESENISVHHLLLNLVHVYHFGQPRFVSTS